MTEIKNVKKNGRRVAVTLSGDGGVEVLALTAPMWDSFGLRPGSALSPEDEEKLRAASALSRAVTDAVRIAADAPHSVFSLVRKLTARGHSKEDAARAVRSLVSAGALNEEKNAEHAARSIFGRTRRGKARIAADLAAKGYPVPVARAAAETISDGEYREALRYHIEKIGGKPGDEKEEAKVAASLGRLGFSAHEIKELLK